MAITMLTVFLTSCEDDMVVETDKKIISTTESVSQIDDKLDDRKTFQNMFGSVVPYIRIEENKYIIDNKTIQLLGFNKTEEISILEYLEFYNEDVLPYAQDITAEEILNGKKWNIEIKDSNKKDCCGASSFSGSITSAQFSLYLDKCQMGIVKDGGCTALVFGGPKGAALALVCHIVVGYVNNNCSCGIYVNGNYDFPWGWDYNHGCQTCGCDCSGKTSNLGDEVYKNLTTFTSSSLKSSTKDLMNLYISNQNELKNIFSSTDQKYAQVQAYLDLFWSDAQPLIQQGFSDGGSATVSKQQIEAAQSLITELAKVVESDDLKADLQDISSNLKLMEGKEIKQAFKAFDAQPINSIK